MDLLSELDPVTASDGPIGSDQYLWVATRAWRLGTFATNGTVHAHLAEHLVTQWIPRQQDREWLLDHRVTGVVRWLPGTDASAQDADEAAARSADAARAQGFDPSDGVAVGRFQAPFGDFHAETQGRHPGRRAQGWQNPTPEFLASLPRDPEELLDRLVTDNPPSRYSGPFVAATGALRTCLVPADLRTALYRALAALPAVTVAHDVADLDGRACVALVHDDGPTRTELLIDPCGGGFAGERDTLRRDSRWGLPAGTMIHTTSVRTGVVDHLGDPPDPVVLPQSDD